MPNLSQFKSRADFNEWYRNYRKNDTVKQKIQVRHKVYVEKRAGRLITQRCHCGIIGEAHHEDYSKPLEILWLCKKHHTELHKEKRRGLPKV